jgi:hypothetical protein
LGKAWLTVVDEEFRTEAERRCSDDPTAVYRLLAEREAKAKAALRYRLGRDHADGGIEAMWLIKSMFAASMAVPTQITVATEVTMIIFAASEELRACNIDGDAQTGDRNSLDKVDLHRRKDTAHGLVADQQCDHRENDATCEPGEIA